MLPMKTPTEKERLLRIREIGRDIAGLSNESKELRTILGNGGGERTVVMDHPDDDTLVLICRIYRATDKCDWNVTFETAPKIE